MSVGSPTAGTWSSSQWRPDNEFETDTMPRSETRPSNYPIKSSRASRLYRLRADVTHTLSRAGGTSRQDVDLWDVACRFGIPWSQAIGVAARQRRNHPLIGRVRSCPAPSCSAPGFLDSGLQVITSTLPRPARRNRVALGLDSDSRTSPASTARCTSVETRARRGGVPRSFRSSAPTRDSPLPCG